MILYRFIHGLIVLISFLKFNLGLGPDIFYVFVDNYIRSSNGDIILYINPKGTRDIPYVISDIPYVISDIPPSMTSSFPSGITNSLPSGITSGIPSSMPNRIPPSMLNSFPLDITSSIPSDIKSGIPPSMTSRFVTDITNSSPSGITSDIPSSMTNRVPPSMLNRFPSDDHKVVHNHLYYHQNNVHVNPTNYLELYKQHFEFIQNESTNNELVNTRKKITINELLNESTNN